MANVVFMSLAILILVLCVYIDILWKIGEGGGYTHQFQIKQNQYYNLLKNRTKIDEIF